jgi:hypothetical protein
MRMHHAYTIAMIAGTGLCTSSLLAQSARLAADSALLARAEVLTVGDYCRVARAVLGSRPVMTALATDSVIVRVSSATICDPLLASFSLRALFGESHAPMAAVARLHTQGTQEARSRIFDAMSEFRATVQSDSAISATVARSLDTTTHRLLIRVSNTVQSLLTSAARDKAISRLARYERKLGPTSARLNGAEVLLNYAAQRWIPAFRADPQQGPSAYELVASYTPGYVTRTSDRVQAVSAAEFGLRRYLFGDRFGQSGYRGLLMPSYWSAGVLTASDRNGALVWPWEARNRAGGYLSWGSLKVAYIPDRAGSFLISKQFQAIPLVF